MTRIKVCGLLAFALCACGVSDRDACRASARPIAACSAGMLSEVQLEMRCDDPGDASVALGCSNEYIVNQGIVNCANAAPAAPTQADCDTFARCVSMARATCSH